MPLISSRTNSKIKALRSLKSKKARSDSGTFLVEGIRHVGEAVESGANILAIYYAPELLHSVYANDLIAEQEQCGIQVFALSGDVFLSVASKDNPQGIIAVVQQPFSSLQEFSPENFPWCVAVVSPQDPGNLGAIFRTVDAVGASGVVLLDGGVDPFHPVAVRASMGTLFWQRLVLASFGEFSRWAIQAHYHVYGSSAKAALDYRQVESYRFPRILLLGSEKEGLTSEQAEVCEFLVRLPMHGKATSLNLAVAAGVLLYSMLGR